MADPAKGGPDPARRRPDPGPAASGGEDGEAVREGEVGEREERRGEVGRADFGPATGRRCRPGGCRRRRRPPEATLGEA